MGDSRVNNRIHSSVLPSGGCTISAQLGGPLSQDNRTPHFSLGQWFSEHPALYYVSSGGVAIYCLVPSLASESKLASCGKSDFDHSRHIRSTPIGTSITHIVILRAKAWKVGAAARIGNCVRRSITQRPILSDFQQFRLHLAVMARSVRLHRIIRQSKTKPCLNMGIS